MPIAYHGRSSSIVVSGTDIRYPWCRPDARRPRCMSCRLAASGNRPVQIDPSSHRRPKWISSWRWCILSRPFASYCIRDWTQGLFVGPGNALGEPIDVGEARKHAFGCVLLNDWSLRDVQGWEGQPLGPFTSKNFVVPLRLGELFDACCLGIDDLAVDRDGGSAGELCVRSPSSRSPCPALPVLGRATADLRHPTAGRPAGNGGRTGDRRHVQSQEHVTSILCGRQKTNGVLCAATGRSLKCWRTTRQRAAICVPGISLAPERSAPTTSACVAACWNAQRTAQIRRRGFLQAVRPSHVPTSSRAIASFCEAGAQNRTRSASGSAHARDA